MLLLLLRSLEWSGHCSGPQSHSRCLILCGLIAPCSVQMGGGWINRWLIVRLHFPFLLQHGSLLLLLQVTLRFPETSILPWSLPEWALDFHFFCSCFFVILMLLHFQLLGIPQKLSSPASFFVFHCGYDFILWNTIYYLVFHCDFYGKRN